MGIAAKGRGTLVLGSESGQKRPLLFPFVFDYIKKYLVL